MYQVATSVNTTAELLINPIFYSWGRLLEIMAHGQFGKGLRKADIEDFARLMVSHCLRIFTIFYLN